MKIINVEQRTPEWFAARLGRVTGSRARDVIATIKSGEAAARRDYRMELIVERYAGDGGHSLSRDLDKAGVSYTFACWS